MLERARPSVLAALAAAFALLVLLPGLGSSDFVGDDEALDAGVVWTIHTQGEWLYPEFNEEYLPPKPPLLYWLAAGVAGITGRADEWAVRLPSALAAAGTVFVTVLAGTRLVGNGGAWIGGLALAVMPVFRDQARLGRADMTMTVFVTAALFLYFTRPAPLAKSDRWLFYLLLGFAALAKGAAGVGMVVVVVAVDAWRDRERGRSLADPAILAFLVVGSFWYVLAAIHWGDRFLVKHVLGENFRHFFGALVVEEKPVRGLLHHLSHFVNVFTGTLPWGFLLPFAFLERRPGADRRGTAALWRWLVAGFVFFTLATRKSPYYLLPIFPPLALVVGEWLWHRIALERSAPRDGRAWLPWALGGGLTVIVALVTWHVAGAPGLDADRLGALRAFVAAAPVLWLGVVIAAAALGVAIGAAVQRRAREFVIASLLAGFALSQVGNAIEIPLSRVQSLRKFALDAAARVDEATPVYFFELPLPAIALYAERTIPTLRAGDERAVGRFALIVPESLADRVPEEWRAGSRVLLEERARVFTRRPMQIRLLEVDAAAGGPGEDSSPGAAEESG